MNELRQPAFDELADDDQAAALAAVERVIARSARPASPPPRPDLAAVERITRVLNQEDDEFDVDAVPWLAKTPGSFNVSGYGAHRPVKVLQTERLSAEIRATIDNLAADGYTERVWAGAGDVVVGAPHGNPPPTRRFAMPEASLDKGLGRVENAKVVSVVLGAGGLGALIAAIFLPLAIAAGVGVAVAAVAVLVTAWLGALPERADRPTLAKYALTSEARAAIVAATVELPADSTEILIARMAEDLAQQIEDSPAWKSDWLELQRASYSPRAAAQAIADDAREVGVVRQGFLKAEKEYEGSAGPARDAVEQNLQWLDSVHQQALVQRVAAMWVYRRRLVHVEEELEQMRQLEELAGFDDTMSQLNAKLGVAALDMDAMKARVAELDALRAQLRRYVNAMNQTLAPSSGAELVLEAPRPTAENDEVAS